RQDRQDRQHQHRQQQRQEHRQQQHRRQQRRRSLDLATLARLAPEAKWLLGRAKKELRLSLRGDLVYGFRDPFATGMMCGFTAVLAPWPALKLTPDFSRGRLDGWLEVSLRAYPWRVLLLLSRTAFRPGVRPLWWSEVKRRLPSIRRKPQDIKEVQPT